MPNAILYLSIYIFIYIYHFVFETKSYPNTQYLGFIGRVIYS